MHIPKHWAKASGKARTVDGREIPATIWGWGDDLGAAKIKAGQRLRSVLERISRGEGFPERYSYDDRPLKEEIIEVIGADPGNPDAIITRNRHGVQVLNTSRLLFLDIDLQRVSCFRRLMTKLGLAEDMSKAGVLERLRETLKQNGRTTFRIYRTAGGLRVIAIDRQFKPDGRDTDELMEATRTDPEFKTLCKVQDSFRARLTPKPWRCNTSSPTTAYPREAMQEQQIFSQWLKDYEEASRGYASCRYLETIGSGRPANFARDLIELHDRLTRCDSDLPLA